MSGAQLPLEQQAVFRYIEADVTDDAKDEVVRELAARLGSGEGTLLVLVESLGRYLTHGDSTLRAQGTELLSAVLADSGGDGLKLPVAQVSYLVQFYCDRFKDLQSIPAALRGIIAVMRGQGLPKGEEPAASVAVARAVFRELHTQSLSQTSRALVFQLFDLLLLPRGDSADTRWRTELVEGMGTDFVYGFVQVRCSL